MFLIQPIYFFKLLGKSNPQGSYEQGSYKTKEGMQSTTFYNFYKLLAFQSKVGGFLPYGKYFQTLKLTIYSDIMFKYLEFQK